MQRHGLARLLNGSTPDKIDDIMDTPPLTPQERAGIMNISPTAEDSSVKDVCLQLPPPSPASSQCAQEPVLAPVLAQSPALDGKDQGMKRSSSPTGDVIASDGGNLATASATSLVSHSAPQASRRAATRNVTDYGAEAGADSRENLRLDVNASPSKAPGPISTPPPPRFASDTRTVVTDSLREHVVRSTRRFFSHSEGEEGQIFERDNSAAWPSQPNEAPSSAPSVFSGIFEIELSPESSGGDAATECRPVDEGEDRPHPHMGNQAAESTEAALDSATNWRWSLIRGGSNRSYPPTKHQQSSWRCLPEVGDSLFMLIIFMLLCLSRGYDLAVRVSTFHCTADRKT